MKTLIVDDSNTMRRIIKNKLLEMGMTDGEMYEAEDGIEALKVLKNTSIKLILLDWNMPKLNGFELLKQLKADDTYKSIPVIMVTTEGGKAEVVSAIKAGVCDYIVKPFDVETIQRKVELAKDKFNIK